MQNENQNQASCIGQATTEQIEKWKRENKQGIYAIESNGHIAYFKRPTRTIFNYSVFNADLSEFMKFWESFSEMSFIGGSREVLENDLLFRGAIDQLRDVAYGIPAEIVPQDKLASLDGQSLNGYVYMTEVASWLNACPYGIYAIKSEGYVAYFKMPDRKVLNSATAVMNASAFMDYWDEFSKLTFLGGSRTIIENDEMMRGAIEQFKTVANGVEAKLVKL